eukprot:1158529-Pelagomonas_calceolata.AAC.18
MPSFRVGGALGGAASFPQNQLCKGGQGGEVEGEVGGPDCTPSSPAPQANARSNNSQNANFIEQSGKLTLSDRGMIQPCFTRSWQLSIQ